MTTTQFATLTRFRTKTNSTTFTDANMLILTNIFKDEIASKIVERNAGYFLIPSTFNLVADKREYVIGDDLLNRLQKVEIKFSSSDSRFPSTFIKDYLGSETESEIVKNFSNAQDGFAHTIRRRAILILSGTIIAVTNGVRIWTHIFPADLSALNGSTGMEVDPSTTTFGFPRQFHELLSRRVAMEWKSSQPKPIPLNQKELAFESDLKIQLDALTPIDNSGEIVADPPSKEDTGNDGYDY